jgi:hypothetical protein
MTPRPNQNGRFASVGPAHPNLDENLPWLSEDGLVRDLRLLRAALRLCESKNELRVRQNQR